MKKKVLLVLFIMVIGIFVINTSYAEEKYDDDYTIEYLLKNYNVVTLGTKDRYQYTILNDNLNSKSGSVNNVFDIGGPVLIRGDFKGNSEYENQYAQKTNGVSSFIKGKVNSEISGSREIAEESAIYFGSENSIGSNNVNNIENKYNYTYKNSNDYINFDNLYAAIVSEQSKIPKGQILKRNNIATKGFNTISTDAAFITISNPGYYTIENAASTDELTIKNYDPNSLYFITITDEVIYRFPKISVLNGAKTFKTSTMSKYSGYDSSDTYTTGNIIWNFPNARYIYGAYSVVGHIVAPKADVELPEAHYAGTIIANSISSSNDAHTAIQFFPLQNEVSLTDEELDYCIEEENDINPDLYSGNYSLDELLKNYSVVTLGQKNYGSNTKLSTLTDKKGTASIFHIGGQFLINGNLGVESIVYSRQTREDTTGVRLDFKYSDYSYNSYIKEHLSTMAYDSQALLDYLNEHYQYARSNRLLGFLYPYLYVGSDNDIYVWRLAKTPDSYDKSDTKFPYFNTDLNGPEVRYNDTYLLDTTHLPVINNNYIDFKTLYDSIVAQQEKIEEGQTVTPDSQGKIHIPIGGNYTIEGIDEASLIIFDNFEDNKDKLTIVTIKDSGSINMPFESSDTWGNVATNDYFGGNTLFSNGTLFTNPEVYYGNIVFNIPNATYIKLASSNSFKGHIIAPNADVETPELNFAGAMIVNSLYSEGHSEAHFYPLTVGSVGTGIDKTKSSIGYCDEEYIDINVEKIWNDANNQDGKRPKEMTINLFANGEKIDSATIKESDDWKYTFKNLKKYNKLKEIVYTITENAIDDYSTEIDKEGSDYKITNGYTPMKTSLTINKNWIDEDDYDKIRPDSVELELYANGKLIDTKEITSENNWVYIFNELDMYSNGERIEYTVKEKTTKGYTSEISGNQEKGYTITNTHEVKKEVKNASESPKTLDNIIKYIVMSCVSLVLITLGITIFIKHRKEA